MITLGSQANHVTAHKGCHRSVHSTLLDTSGHHSTPPATRPTDTEHSQDRGQRSDERHVREWTLLVGERPRVERSTSCVTQPNSRLCRLSMNSLNTRLFCPTQSDIEQSFTKHSTDRSQRLAGVRALSLTNTESTESEQR